MKNLERSVILPTLVRSVVALTVFSVVAIFGSLPDNRNNHGKNLWQIMGLTSFGAVYDYVAKEFGKGIKNVNPRSLESNAGIVYPLREEVRSNEYSKLD